MPPTRWRRGTRLPGHVRSMEGLGVSEPVANQVLRLLARLDERCEFVECHPPAGFVVGW